MRVIFLAIAFFLTFFALGYALAEEETTIMCATPEPFMCETGEYLPNGDPMLLRWDEIIVLNSCDKPRVKNVDYDEEFGMVTFIVVCDKLRPVFIPQIPDYTRNS